MSEDQATEIRKELFNMAAEILLGQEEEFKTVSIDDIVDAAKKIEKYVMFGNMTKN